MAQIHALAVRHGSICYPDNAYRLHSCLELLHGQAPPGHHEPGIHEAIRQRAQEGLPRSG